ncbi:hypothetical protein PHLGIDRAFT_234644 [Phlebiopsis gigantea 11061_1 CR5-6]|uniref:Secreted protein n=1 Tax=Phlebiopsis gigantea (strain 11061_1 CR5-6) TaxID=745531 RepID=A0A0C3PDW6_PHLG1|nr:hypothetical protein PHLGIDRAFT_234644 [Phlebiopsis gigantea 11061_1 CR5-6]
MCLLRSLISLIILVHSITWVPVCPHMNTKSTVLRLLWTTVRFSAAGLAATAAMTAVKDDAHVLLVSRRREVRAGHVWLAAQPRFGDSLRPAVACKLLTFVFDIDSAMSRR